MRINRRRWAVAGVASIGCGLVLGATPSTATVAEDVKRAIKLYEAVMADSDKLAETCIALRQLSELQRGGTVVIDTPSVPNQEPQTDNGTDDGWTSGTDQQAVSGSETQLTKSALVASNAVLAVSVDLHGRLERGSPEDAAFRDVVARLFDKCTM